MRILLVDTSLYAPASPFFVDAAQEAGYDARFIDDASYLRPLATSLLHKVAYRILGRRPLTSFAFNRLLRVEARRFRPDIVLAVKSPFVTPATLRQIKADTGAILVNYATDDPFNPANATPDLRHSIPVYDVYACTKRAIMEDIRRAGGRIVIYTMFGYKPAVHFPERPATDEEARRFRSDVVVVGGADPDRLRDLEPLFAARDVTLALYGGYWSRDRRFAPYARGFAVGRDYRLALGGARIALCLVRRANRDGHAMRTFEIPACGAFMLAERTAEHLALFREDEEAVFFGSPGEMVDKVRYYLAHDDVRRRIAEAGHARVTGGGHTYLARLREIVQAAARTESQG